MLVNLLSSETTDSKLFWKTSKQSAKYMKIKPCYPHVIHEQ